MDILAESVALCLRTNNSPFTEVWHNNKPLIVCLISALPRGSLCYQCGVEFPPGSLSAEPFDIALKHEERWKYSNKTSASPKYFVSSKMTTKYYCISKKCIMDRFPYFNREFLDISKISLENDHIKYIQVQLEVNLS